MKYTFLIVDGDNGEEMVPMLQASFPVDDISVIITGESEQGLRYISDYHPSVILYDMCLADMKGTDFLSSAKKIDHSISVIMTTACGNVNDAIETIRHGAFDYLIKPPDAEMFGQLLRKAMECNILSRRVRYIPTSQHLDESELDENVMIGSSPKLMEIWKLVGRIADNDATVLIEGESGTGKELLAKAIFSHSNRNKKPFLAINCAAMPENLLESELFGHEKGAFTDAHQRRIGKFEHCNGGTILLDEISEMSLSSQSKLLRVLENQEFERVGGNEVIKTDVRVIASTNTNLQETVRKKLFRIDLYHRLKGINIHLPPLRDRPEDIPLLIDLFCRIFSAKYGKPVSGVSIKAKEYLNSYPWAGNIRELKNVIASAVALAHGEIIRLEDLTQILPETTDSFDRNRKIDDYYAYFVSFLENKVDSCHKEKFSLLYQDVYKGLEKATIELALKKYGNNQVQTAKVLGMSRNTLRNRIERYRLEEKI